jgi:hypothetical protein
MTVRLIGSPLARIDALKGPRSGSRSRFGFGGTSRATSCPRRTTDTGWPDETSSSKALSRLRTSATLTVFTRCLLYNSIVHGSTPPLMYVRRTGATRLGGTLGWRRFGSDEVLEELGIVVGETRYVCTLIRREGITC